MGNPTKTTLDHALEYAAEGLAVFPLHSVREDGSCTCGDGACKQQGKHPRTGAGHKEATTDEKKIRSWWGPKRWPNANIGAVSPEFLCLDIDVKNGGRGMRSLERLIADNAPLPETSIAQTGLWEYEDGETARGRHYWFHVPKGVQVSSKVGLREGVDLKCGNGYAILPPSSHKSGVKYEWLVAPKEVGFEDAPEWLLDLAPEAKDPNLSWAPNPEFRMAKEIKDFLKGIYEPDDGQRDFLVRAARSILTTGASIERCAGLLWEGFSGDGGISSCAWADDAWPWTEEDCLFIADNAYRTAPSSGMETEFGSGDDSEEIVIYNTDWGNARRLVSTFGKDEVFAVQEWDKWYIWAEGTWREDSGKTLRLRMETVAREMFIEAAALGNKGKDDQAKKLMAHGFSSQAKGKVDSAVSLACDLVAVPPDALNADPFLLNVKNGVVDLRTGALLEHDPSLRLTKQIRSDYVKGARHELWDKVLADWVPTQEMRDFLQRVFGYALTGVTDEHKFFYFYGPPGTGKSTLLEAMQYLMGNYAETSEPETFMLQRQSGGPTEDVARLAAARMVVTHEVEEGAKFAEAKISHFTGGDSVTARFLHAQSFTFKPKFKLFFTANHMPRVSGSTQSGLWRRLIVVKFDRVIPETSKDPMLASRLRRDEVLQAMLSWAVEGARLWMQDYEAGRLMKVPDEVKEAVEEYRTDADHVVQFIKEVCVLTEDPKDRIAKPDFRAMYELWCKDNGIRVPKSAKSVSQRVKEQGFQPSQARFGSKVKDCWTNMLIPTMMPNPSNKAL